MTAIERKQVGMSSRRYLCGLFWCVAAQQEAERSKYEVIRAEQEKRAAIVTAEGEATAAALISNAMAKTGSGFIELRRIEAAKDIAANLSNAKNVTYLPGAANVLMQMK